MDASEVHYLTFDPEAIYREMLMVYMENGGEMIYPGDEKEILLRSVQAILVQGFAGVDNALRMATLRYAVGDYLDLYGQKRGCYRLEAAAARAEIQITFKASGTPGTIPEGTVLTADGERMYLLDEAVTDTGVAQTVRAFVTAEEKGAAGNGLVSGTQMQFLVSQYRNVESVFTVSNAAGGEERETDENYRNRIREFGFANITTGPKVQYESAAKNVSSEILDARANNTGAGNVGIVLLLKNGSASESIIHQVEQALDSTNVRPLTDNVTVSLAEDVTYTLNVQYLADSSSGIASAVAAAAADYQKWQDETIGRAFNPDRLIASIYQAGASRVLFAEGSNFDGGDVTYTEIEPDERCKGTISIEVITA